jgi:hypothetical protein
LTIREETNSVIDTIWMESSDFSMSCPSLNHFILMGGSPDTTEQTTDALIPSSKLSGKTNGLITMGARGQGRRKETVDGGCYRV